MRVGAIDIGTNSMRLLIQDDDVEVDRRVVVTGLGRGVDASGVLAVEAIADTVAALAGFGAIMDDLGVERRRAIATSASRDALNREHFFDLAESVLGVRPDLISGAEEAAMAYRGATSGLGLPLPVLVSDIGGGSSEFVTQGGGVSVDIGSVRLTERHLGDRPPDLGDLAESRSLLAALFSEVEIASCRTLVGVAGTWTSLAAISLGLAAYDRSRVHLSTMSSAGLEELVDRLSGLTVEETAAIPALDPARAPVILAGGLIAEAVMTRVGASEVHVSEHDTLDAVAAGLLALS